MSDHQKQVFFTKGKLIRAILTMILIGSASVYLLTRISTLENLQEVLEDMPLTWVLLGAGAEIISFWGSGYRLKFIIHQKNSRFSVWRGVLIVMAATSIGLVAGGWVSYAAASIYFAAKEDSVPGSASLAGIIPSIFNMGLLVLTTILGILYLLLNHEISEAQLFFYGFFLMIVCLGVVIMVYGLFRRQQMIRGILWVAGKLRRFKTFDIERVRGKIEAGYPLISLIDKRRWIQIGLGSLLWTFLDLLSLYFFFIAAGYAIKPGVLTAGYSIAFILGKATLFVPGGAGIIESSMAAIYYNLGIPYHFSTVAILGYRLVSFWIPGVLGFAALFYLQKAK